LEHFSASRALYTKYPPDVCRGVVAAPAGKIAASAFSLLRQQNAQSGIYFRHLCHLLAGARKFRSSLEDGMERCSKETEND
jgi:hypothetical protein